MTDIAEARARYQAGDVAGAEEACREILGREPSSWAALQLMGLAAQRRGDSTIAEGHFARAASLAPDRPELHRELGNTLLALGRPGDAVAAFEAALALNPNDVAALNGLGIAALHRRQFVEAIDAFQRALALDPGLVAAANNLGNVHRERGELSEAEAWYRRALALAPERASAANNLAVALRDQGKLREAISEFRHALALDPASVAARANLGAALSQIGERGEALAEFRRAFGEDPKSERAAAGLLHEMTQLADWQEMEGIAATVDRMNEAALSAARPAPEQPFHNIARCDDPAYNLRIARSACRAISGKVDWLRPRLRRAGRPETDARIRLGYLSADIWDHPIAHLTAGLFGAHDRRHFAVRLYAYGRDDGSEYRRYIRRDVECFIDIDRLDSLAAAQRIVDDGIDILIDLTGHTSGGRLEIAALRPAPLQLHWLGYPGSIGGDFLDYLIADRTVVPAAHAQFYAEKIVRLPHSYQVNNGGQAIEQGLTRHDCGLPDKAFVLCCFNQISKIEPAVFSLWMKLLACTPRAVLWLLAGHPMASLNLKRAAAAHGIAPDRLIFAGKLPKQQHLARIALADLALDTRIYNGHTTSSDALFAGLPVVALRGRHFPSLVSASLLHTQALDELIADNLDGYFSLAQALIGDPARLARLRERTSNARASRPLFDTQRFARNLETAYRAMWERQRAGLPPESFDVLDEAPESL
jgi:protein O-GlcNAc transferase